MLCCYYLLITSYIFTLYIIFYIYIYSTKKRGRENMSPIPFDFYKQKYLWTLICHYIHIADQIEIKKERSDRCRL